MLSTLIPYLFYKKKAVRLITNRYRNIHTIYEQPHYTVRLILNSDDHLVIDLLSEPAIYWYVDSFVKVPSDPIFKDLGILKVQDVYKLTTLKFIYESLNKLNPTQFHTYFKYTTGIQTTTASRNNNLDPPMVRTVTYGLKSLKYSGCKLWNNLPMNIRNAVSIDVFNFLNKKHMINSYTNNGD